MTEKRQKKMKPEYPPQRSTHAMSTTALYKVVAASAAGGEREVAAAASVMNGNGVLSRMSSSSSSTSVTNATPMLQGESMISTTTRNVAGSPPPPPPPQQQSRNAAGAGGIAEHFPDDDTFRMFEFKVRKCPCTRPHDWTQCPFVHPGERARRRCPKKYNYSATPCPDFKRGACKRGDACEFAHGVFEVNLHPTRYRTSMCTEGANCTRKICFFAHKPSQLRYVDGGGNSATQCLPASVQLQLAQSLEECHNGAAAAAAAAAAADQMYCPPATMESKASTNGVSSQQQQQQPMMMRFDSGGSSSTNSSSNSISQMGIGEHQLNQQQQMQQPPPPPQQQQQQMQHAHAMLVQQQQQQQQHFQNQEYVQPRLQQQQHMQTASMEPFAAGRLSASAMAPALAMHGHERVPPTSRQGSSDSIMLKQAEYNAQLISAINRAFAPPANVASQFHMNRSRSELALDENFMRGQCMVDDLVM